jgi:hypothetical protein
MIVNATKAEPLSQLAPFTPFPSQMCVLTVSQLTLLVPMPPDESFDSIITMTDHLGADIHIVLSSINLSVEQFTVIFFDHWYCENSFPTEIICDHNKLFLLKFWKSLV